VVFGNVVIVVAAAESQSIIGFDKTSGKEVWRKEARGLDNMWGTPALIKVDDKRTDLVMCVANEIWGLDPANGDFLWLAGKTGASSAYSSVFSGADNKRVYAMPSSRNGGGSMAVDAGGEGDVTETMVAWKGRDAAGYATPVVHGGKIYNVANDVVTVIDAKTGERSGERFRLKGYMASRLEYPSPIVAGDRLFRLNGRGQVFVLALGDEPKQIAVNRLTNDDAEVFWGTPAVSDGRMLVRSSQYLYCVADKGETVSEDDMKMAKAAPSTGARSAGGNQNRRRTLNDVFAENDANKDGKLEKSEVEKITFMPTERLMTLDKDEDGAISKDEFQNVRSLFQQGRGGRGGADENGASKPDRPQRPKFRNDK
jgi:outer membrane protein assembly factor BamB